MKLLEKICKELGVEIGEEWTGNDGFNYIIKKNGDITVRDTDDVYYKVVPGEVYERIIKEELKPRWKPEIGETYYIPYIHSKEEERQLQYIWEDGRRTDKFMWNNNLVFQTKEEAIAAANKMLEALKEEG